MFDLMEEQRSMFHSIEEQGLMYQQFLMLRASLGHQNHHHHQHHPLLPDKAEPCHMHSQGLAESRTAYIILYTLYITLLDHI